MGADSVSPTLSPLPTCDEVYHDYFEIISYNHRN